MRYCVSLWTKCRRAYAGSEVINGKCQVKLILILQNIICIFISFVTISSIDDARNLMPVKVKLPKAADSINGYVQN